METHEKYLVNEVKTEKAAETQGPIVRRFDGTFRLSINTETLEVTAMWGWKNTSIKYKAKTLKQAWWHWYNPWPKGFVGDYERKTGGKIDFSK